MIIFVYVCSIFRVFVPRVALTIYVEAPTLCDYFLFSLLGKHEIAIMAGRGNWTDDDWAAELVQDPTRTIP